MLIGPVFQHGKLVGVIEMINKKRPMECVLDVDNTCQPSSSSSDVGPVAPSPSSQSQSLSLKRSKSISQQYEAFSKNDERLMQMLCSHCSIFLEQMDECLMEISDLVPSSSLKQ